jgi:hypothetical protein
MKGFWVALILLLALTVAVFTAAHKVDGVLSSLTEALLRDDLFAFERLWERHEPLFRLTLHRGETAQIDERLAALKAAASLGDASAYALERARLLSAISRVGDTVSPSLFDLF